MNTFKIRSFTVALLGSAVLTACGGGSGNDGGIAATGNTSTNTTTAPVTSTPGATTPAASGTVGTTTASNSSGTTSTTKTPATTSNDDSIALPTTVISSVFNGTNDSGQPLTVLLQDDGSYFMVYSSATAPQSFSGVILGTGTLSNGGFSSANGSDLSLIGTGSQSANPITLSASYTQKASVNGSISYTAGTQAKTFTTSYNSAYATLPALSSVAGVYSGSIATKYLREDNIELTIAEDGTLSGKLTCGCSVGAQLVPRKDGIAYDATLAFTQGTHDLTGKSFAGNVYLDVANKRLYIVGKISNSPDLAVFVGKKS